ncbi:hypothetical protein [Maricaulis virginensis]|uniref:Glycine zipper family protein n=1 Tax=Maricaulis virginensis TaxID=144022 RepID=A0A9W6IMX6_9PROT|nr:hypothetical protein [Maricaulis virginensis]GLK52115.1 hypothetical protein GCM10017621_16230 [Maricaulis virginensis]
MSGDKDETPQSGDNVLALGLPLGLPIGLALGVSLGVALESLAIGISLGVAFGMSLSLAFGAAKAKELKNKRDAASDGDASDEEKS